MKQSSDSAAVGRAPEREEFVSRKLIRPILQRPELHPGGEPQPGAAAAVAPALERRPRPAKPQKKAPALEQTHAENFYFQKQMQSKTLMTFVLKNGEEIQGFIDWYDRGSIRVTRTARSALVIYKNNLRYLYKTG